MCYSSLYTRPNTGVWWLVKIDSDLLSCISWTWQVVHPHQKTVDCFDPLHDSNDDAFNWIWLDNVIICIVHLNIFSNLRLYICTEVYHNLKQRLSISDWKYNDSKVCTSSVTIMWCNIFLDQWFTSSNKFSRLRYFFMFRKKKLCFIIQQFSVNWLYYQAARLQAEGLPCLHTQVCLIVHAFSGYSYIIMLLKGNDEHIQTPDGLWAIWRNAIPIARQLFLFCMELYKRYSKGALRAPG
jgi:hypothetical protein